MATPQRYRFRSGVEYLIDLDAIPDPGVRRGL